MYYLKILSLLVYVCISLFNKKICAQDTTLHVNFTTKSSLTISQSQLETTDKMVIFKKELELSIYNSIDKETACHMIFVNQGSSAWSLENRLQGWIDVPLSNEGRNEIGILSKQLKTIHFNAIFCSDLERSRETASIIAEHHACPVITAFALRGESHGILEGMTPQEYRQQACYKQYKSLTHEEKIFFSMGEGGESKADVARRMIPFLKHICKENQGKTVLIVTHGGNIKFLNYLMGYCTEESFISLPHGTSMSVYFDGKNFIKEE